MEIQRNDITDTQELMALNRLSTALSESLDLENVLDVALSETMRILGANNGGIYVFNPVNNKLTLKVSHNLTDAFVAAKTIITTDEGCAGTAYNTKEIFSGYGTPEKAYICADAKDLMGIDCLGAAPIIFKGEVLGILELFAPVDRKLSKRELDLLNSICGHIGVAISNADSHEALKRSLRDSKLLLQASETIVSSLRLDEILERLIGLASELTQISRAAIWLYSTKRDTLILSRHFETLPAGFSLSLKEMPGPIGTAIGEKKAISIDDFSQTAERVEQLATQFSIKAMLAVPIIFKSRTVGLLTLDKPGIRHIFSEQEVELAEGIARQAAIALENSRVYEEQRTISETLQKSFMPLEFPEFEEIDIGVRYESASFGALVGGDFYDFINVQDCLGFVIGDVSGKGIEATIQTGLVKNSVRIAAIDGLRPAEVISKTSKLIVRQSKKNQFVTLIYGCIDLEKGEIIYVNAGHPLALLNSKEGTIELGYDNPPVGVDYGKGFVEKKQPFLPGDTLLLYTDGVIEARRGKELYGFDRLQEVFEKHVGSDVDSIAGQILDNVSEFSKNQLNDDIAILVIRRLHYS